MGNAYSRYLLEAVQNRKTTYWCIRYGGIDREHPEHLVAARSGSPLVIGLGIGENFLASDQLALLSVTRRFIYLEEGDIAEITRRTVDIYDANGQK